MENCEFKEIILQVNGVTVNVDDAKEETAIEENNNEPGHVVAIVCDKVDESPVVQNVVYVCGEQSNGTIEISTPEEVTYASVVKTEATECSVDDANGTENVNGCETVSAVEIIESDIVKPIESTIVAEISDAKQNEPEIIPAKPIIPAEPIDAQHLMQNNETRNNETVNTVSSQCEQRDCIDEGKHDKDTHSLQNHNTVTLPIDVPAPTTPNIVTIGGGIVETPQAKKATSPEKIAQKQKKRAKTPKNKKSPKKQDNDLSQCDDYSVAVSPRQRTYFLQPPRGQQMNAPTDDCEIFCTNIPINVLESELVPLFERYGQIWELRLLMSKHNASRNAGFAFVRFTTAEAATNAVEKLDKYEIVPGKYLSVRLSQPNITLFVGNIHRGQTREQVHEKIGRLTSGLVKTVVKSSFYEEAKNCGFCFLEYETHAAAMKAKQLLNSGRYKVWGRQLYVDWSQRRAERDPEMCKESKTLFFNNLPKSMELDKLKEILLPFGTEQVTLIKDYAFAMFNDHEAAVSALNSIDINQLGGEPIGVSLALPKHAAKNKSNRFKMLDYRRVPYHFNRRNNMPFRNNYRFESVQKLSRKRSALRLDTVAATQISAVATSDPIIASADTAVIASDPTVATTDTDVAITGSAVVASTSALIEGV